MDALRLWTVGSSWFSGEDGKKGAIVPGQLADLAVLSADYFSVPDEEIKHLESVLTIVGGRPVYAAEEFSKPGPAAPARPARVVSGSHLWRLRPADYGPGVDAIAVMYTLMVERTLIPVRILDLAASAGRF